MELDFEVLILLITALMFMVAYLLSEQLTTKLVLGAIDIICWFALSLIYVASETTFPIISLIFMAIGTVFAIWLVIGSFDMWKNRDRSWR